MSEVSQPVAPFATFVGVDLHKQSVTLRAVDRAGGPVASLTCDTKCVQRIEQWLLALPRPCHLAVEAVGFVEWFVDRFRACVDRMDLADATALANRRGKRRKNDRNDALDVAVRLARGDCPLSWIADEPVMQLRKLGRHWRSLSRTLARAKHCMRSMLLAANLRGPKLDGPSAQKWLLAHGHLLKDVQRQAFGDFLDLVCLIERQRESLRRKIIFANRTERFAALCAVLKSVPGIDEVWACVIASEVGDFSRFPNADALEFWAGLTPDNQSSAGRTTSGHITKAGSACLRWAVCKAAVTLCRSDARQEKVRQRLVRRVGKPKANVAMGRRLLRTLFAMARDGTAYQGQEPTGYERAATKARLEKRTRARGRNKAA
ncbi:MAG TPA: IS110 family transposase [Hyphomicrobiaceae bacterium]